jgi:oxygen-independent coproporphyrinogen-3 oxidase
VDAICQEIRRVSSAAPRALPELPAENQRIPAHTVFFGGGTPSLLSPAQIDQILKTLRDSFDFQPNMEITLEANPGTVTAEYLCALRETGVNRLSFGMQSAHPDDLRLLERQHDFFDVVQAVQWARKAGFDNLSLDLIFGLPGQDLERWKTTIDRAVGMEPDHLSLYALTIEHGTPLQKRWVHGLIPAVDDDLAADMYEYAMDRLEALGFIQYEISNWAKTSTVGTLLSSRHNLQYWLNQPYLGFGPGAHGFAHGQRTMNIGGIRPYIERCGKPESEPFDFPVGPATRKTIPVDAYTEMQETMMVGLRLTQQGVHAGRFFNRFGRTLEDVFGKEIERLTRIGLLEWCGADQRQLRLTRRGRMLGNQVFMQFVG